MKLKVWYRIALFLPLLVPLFFGLLMGLLRALNPFEGVTADLIVTGVPTGIFALTGAPLLIAGIPYFFFVLAVLWWGERKQYDGHQMRRMSWWLPLLFVPICPIGVMLLVMMDGTNESLAGTYIAAFYISLIFVPLYGYFYVLLAHGLTWLLKRANVVKEGN